jgi:hypothetical protein
MHIKLDKPFITGNFELGIEGELNEASLAKFVQSGMIYVVQRDGASKTYKELLPTEKGEKAAKRNTLDYSDDNAAKMKTAMENALKSYGDFTVSVTEHIPGETVTPMVRATKFVDDLLAKDEAGLRAVLQAGYGAKPGASREELIETAHKMFQSQASK